LDEPPKLVKVRYESNNSRGDWWLSDRDWVNLEAAGWEVTWTDLSPDTPATSASVLAPSLEEAIAEWERITGENSNDEGCNCCGRPHRFSVEEE